MMDKKVILAFALSVAVFVLYSFFLGPQEPVKPPTPSPGPTSGTPIVDSKAAPPLRYGVLGHSREALGPVHRQAGKRHHR